MKFNLVLLTLSVAAATLCLEAPAMMRGRIKPSLSHSIIAKIPHQSFSSNKPHFYFNVPSTNLKKHSLTLPQLPVHRIDSAAIDRHKKYENLTEEWNFYNEMHKDDKKFAVRTTAALYGMASFFAALFHMGIEDALPLAVLSGFHAAAATPLRLPFTYTLLTHEKKNCKKIESKLAELVAEQKRELRLRDDIQ